MPDSSVPLGDIIYSAVKPIFKIYIIMAFGFYLGKKNVIAVDTTRNLSDLVVTLALPCLLFNKMVTNLESSDIKQIGIVGLVSVLLTSFGAVGGYLSYLLSKPKYWKGSSVCVGMLSNISDLPIAYLQTFAVGGLIFTDEEGEKGISYICVFTMFQIFFQFNLGFNKLIGYDFDQQTKVNKKLDEEKSIDQVLETSSSNSEIESVTDLNAVPLTLLNSNTSNASRYLSRVTTAEIRRQPTQTINDIINEYSASDALKKVNSRVRPGQFTDLEVVSDEPEIKKIEESKFKNLLLFFYDNMRKPISVTLVVAITISMIPWVKGLFVTGQSFVHIPNAPDQQPPLSFIMDFTSYLGNACVPLGLLILGATLSRLRIGEMEKNFWLTPLAITIYKLVISPIIGVCIILGLSQSNMFQDDDILKFICTIVWCLPNATSIIYITAFYNPIDDDRFNQMDYLALTYIMEYPLLAIALPFLTTFTIKVLL